MKRRSSATGSPSEREFYYHSGLGDWPKKSQLWVERRASIEIVCSLYQ